VKRYLFGPHGILLFRSYLFLAAGLVIVATILDLGFDYLRSKQTSEEEPWLASTFDLIEAELAAVPEGERERRARELGEKIGVGVQILRTDDVYAAVDAEGAILTLVDSEGNISHLRDAPTLNAILRLGPVAQQRDSLVIRLLPPLFYLSIFVVVGLWLRPFFRDINLISSGADRFAADYREPLSTAEATTRLTGLASNLDDMSARLSGLIQSQKELIAALSHEMRTPLARIRFALAVMDNDSGEDLAERRQALNQDVQEIDDLISTMLNYARLDHPDLQMNWQDVPITPWLAETQDKVQASNEVTIRTDVASTVARMDPRLMSLALSNLLVNACRYANREVRCTIAETVRNYEIRVEDDGEGIPEGEREAIFKAFARADDSRNRETGGFGLGLAIVARIAALHGGNASARESRELGGACFVLTWPRRVECEL
jgi:signal transduction histidine kinase